jgi:hypothetical protein
MDHGPSRREHFGARGGSPPQVGCAAPTAPPALRRRLSDLRIGEATRSSDRAAAFPVSTMTVWPEPALQLAGDAGATSRQGPTSGWRLRFAHRRSPSGFCCWVRRSVPLREERTRVARRRRHLRVRASAASSLDIMYAGDRGRMASTSSNHRRRSSERALGRERVSSEMRRDDVGNRAPSGAGTDAVDLLSGWIRWHPTVLRGPCWDAAEATPSGGAGANCVRSQSTLRGRRRYVTHGARQGRNSIAFSRRSGRGTPKRLGREAKRPSKDGAARFARQHRERDRSKAQGSIERARSGNVARNATDSSVEESLEVDEQDGAPWRHGSGYG